jgi:hypothetical protein
MKIYTQIFCHIMHIEMDLQVIDKIDFSLKKCQLHLNHEKHFTSMHMYKLIGQLEFKTTLILSIIICFLHITSASDTNAL